MNKMIIVGIVIAIIIGIVGIFGSMNTNEVSTNENTKPKPKQIVVGLEENIGISSP